MKLSKTVFRLFAALILATSLIGPASANEWPNRPIKMIVPAGPGSGTDMMARLMSDHLSKALGQPIVIDNKAGANGIIGNEAAARATPDGYTLLFSNASSVSLNAALRPQLKYDTINDFRPIVQLSNGGVLIVVDPSLGVKNLKEFVTYVRQHPGMSYATWGVGSTGHLNMEALIAEYDLKMVHVPYRAMGQIVTDMMGGQIKIASVDARSPAALIEAGKVIAIAMTGSRRGPLLPDVPTLAEQGFDFQMDGWYGILAPAGTPEAIVQRVHAEALKIRNAPELQKTFRDINLPPPPQKTPDEFAQTIKDEIVTWKKVIVKADIKAE